MYKKFYSFFSLLHSTIHLPIYLALWFLVSFILEKTNNDLMIAFCLVSFILIIFFLLLIAFGTVVINVFSTITIFFSMIKTLAVTFLGRNNTNEMGDKNPYNFLLDYVIPYAMLFSSVFPLSLSFSLSQKIFTIVLYHIIILVPFIIIWDRLRGWEGLYIIHSFSRPEVVRYVILGLVYPYVYIVILGVLRCFALGKKHTYDFSFFTIDIALWSCVFFPSFAILFIELFRKYNIYLKFFLNHSNLCTYSMHIFCLRNNFYYSVVEKCQKLNFYITEIFWLDSLLNHYRKKNIKYPNFYRVTRYLWMFNPNVILFIVPLFVIIEYYMSRCLYYSFYVFFVMFLLRLSFKIFNNLGASLVLAHHCCYSDYLAGKWENPRFPRLFPWICLQPEIMEAPKLKIIPEKYINYFNELLSEKPKKGFPGEHTFSLEKERKHYPARVAEKNLSYFQKVQLLYMRSSGVVWTRRFVHTGHVKTPAPLHPGVIFLVQHLPARLQFVAEADLWRTNMPKLQKLEKTYPSILVPGMYDSNLPLSISEQSPTTNLIMQHTEYNTLTALSLMLQKGIYPSLHKPFYIYSNQLEQTDPDIALKHWLGLFGLDQKCTPSDVGANIIMAVNDSAYRKYLSWYEIKYKPCLTPDALVSLNNLKKISSVNERILHYAEDLHLFVPAGKLPPLNLGKMVSSEMFSPEFKETYANLEEKIRLLSIICNNHEPLPQVKNNVQLRESLLKKPNVLDLLKNIDELFQK